MFYLKWHSVNLQPYVAGTLAHSTLSSPNSSSAPNGKSSSASLPAPAQAVPQLILYGFHYINSATRGGSQPRFIFPQISEALLILRQDLGKFQYGSNTTATPSDQLTFKRIALCTFLKAVLHTGVHMQILRCQTWKHLMLTDFFFFLRQQKQH